MNITKEILLIFVGACITILMSLGGAWIMSEKQMVSTMQDVSYLKERIGAVEKKAEALSPIPERVSRLEIVSTSIEEKVGNLEVSSARSISALEGLTEAVNVLSTNTGQLIKTNSELAVIVGRLEERTK